MQHLSEQPLALEWIELTSLHHIQRIPPDVLTSEESLMTTTCVEQGHAFYLKEHLQRLFQHIQLDHAMLNALIATLQVWLAAYKKEPVLRLRMVLVMQDDVLAPAYLSMQLFRYVPIQGSLRMLTRPAPYSPFPKLKNLATLRRMSLLREAQKMGYDDAIACSEQGDLLETTFGNVFWIDNKTLFTPSPALPYYLGVTLSMLLTHSPWKVEFVQYSAEQIPQQASVFRVNALAGPVEIAQIENLVFAQDPLLHATLKQLWIERS